MTAPSLRKSMTCFLWIAGLPAHGQLADWRRVVCEHSVVPLKVQVLPQLYPVGIPMCQGRPGPVYGQDNNYNRYLLTCIRACPTAEHHPLPPILPVAGTFDADLKSRDEQSTAQRSLSVFEPGAAQRAESQAGQHGTPLRSLHRTLRRHPTRACRA